MRIPSVRPFIKKAPPASYPPTASGIPPLASPGSPGGADRSLLFFGLVPLDAVDFHDPALRIDPPAFQPSVDKQVHHVLPRTAQHLGCTFHVDDLLFSCHIAK